MGFLFFPIWVWGSAWRPSAIISFGTGHYKRNPEYIERPNTAVNKTGNGERGTGNGERGTGNRQRESGNECTAVTRLRIQHGGQRKRKGNNLGKCKEVLRL